MSIYRFEMFPVFIFIYLLLLLYLFVKRKFTFRQHAAFFGLYFTVLYLADRCFLPFRFPGTAPYRLDISYIPFKLTLTSMFHYFSSDTYASIFRGVAVTMAVSFFASLLAAFCILVLSKNKGFKPLLIKTLPFIFSIELIGFVLVIIGLSDSRSMDTGYFIAEFAGVCAGYFCYKYFPSKKAKEMSA